MNLFDALKQYLSDAAPGGSLNPEVTPQGLLDVAAMASTPVPVIGDVLGLAADAKRLYDNPNERTAMNYGMSALGLLPFMPSMGSIKSVRGPQADALETAQKNAVTMLGLPPNNTAMDRARALGFEDTFHGSRHPDGVVKSGLIPGGADGSTRAGDAYGVGVYTTSSPSEASSSVYTGESGAVFPLMIRRSGQLNTDAPTKGDLKKLSDFAEENLLPSDKARFDAGVKQRVFKPSDVEDAKDFFRSQQKNADHFGNGYERTQPIVDKDASGNFVIHYTDFDAPISINGAEDLNQLMRSVGWDSVPSMGFTGHTMKRNGGQVWDVTTNPSILRSRFAAFDPARVNENDLLGSADPRLLGLMGVLGAGGLGGAYLYNQDKK